MPSKHIEDSSDSSMTVFRQRKLSLESDSKNHLVSLAKIVQSIEVSENSGNGYAQEQNSLVVKFIVTITKLCYVVRRIRTRQLK